MTDGINRAIATAHSSGVVTSATLMANSDAFEQAVHLAKQNAKLGVGCHVVLVDGGPIAPANELSSLTKTDTGLFRSSISSLGAAALRGALNAQQIEREVTAPIEQLRAAGIQPT